MRYSLRVHFENVVHDTGHQDYLEALAWLDAFEKHAPAMVGALGMMVNEWGDAADREALDWLEATTREQETTLPERTDEKPE